MSIVKKIKIIKPVKTIEPDMGIDITDFADIVKIPTHHIWYYKGDETPSKKHPIGEKNNITLDLFDQIKKNAEHKMRKKPTETYKRQGNKFIPDHILTPTEFSSLTPTNTLFVKYVPNLYCIDVDVPEIHNMEDFINVTGCDVLSECCWCEGNTKRYSYLH